MKIVYCGAFRLPNLDAAAPRVLNNGRAMQACGHTVSFISWGGNYRASDICPDGKYRIEGMEYAVTNEIDNTGNIISRLKALHRRGEKTITLLEGMTEKPDVIIMYNADYRWTRKLLAYCRQWHIRLVNDITEWYDKHDLHFYDRLPYHVNMVYTQKRVNNKIVISSCLANYYKESNNIVIPPLCNIKEEKWNISLPQGEIESFNGITLIYAGNPKKKDDVHTVINVVNELANEGAKVRFIILGITKGDYLKKYASLLKTKEISRNIIFMGRVSQDLIPAYYKKADFMILLREKSRKNMAGFPTKFAESFCAGVPVITTKTSDLKKYLVDGVTGFFLDDNDENSLRDLLINKVLNLSKDEKENMKRRVESEKLRFHYETYIEPIGRFLDSMTEH